jgi:DNA-binding NarL/FixJ family response regulator
MRPFVIVEERGAQDTLEAELIGAGWTVQAPGSQLTAGTVVSMIVAEPGDAQAAVLLAVGGAGLLVRAVAERAVVDDLVEDLSRIGPVSLIDPSVLVRLDPHTWRLVHAVADGATVGAAARALHMSIRTANRRLTDAREALGAPNRAQLVRALTGPGRVPAARLSR